MLAHETDIEEDDDDYDGDARWDGWAMPIELAVMRIVEPSGGRGHRNGFVGCR